MDAREERLVRNEALYRDVNERIDQVAEEIDRFAAPEDGHVYKFFCECSNRDCTLMLPLTIALYENVRSNPRAFVVAPGHDLPEIETVVERGDGYQVVVKVGEAAKVAEAKDPRS